MMELLAASDFERLLVLGHSLKGSGGSFGFPELTRFGAALERSAQASIQSPSARAWPSLKIIWTAWTGLPPRRRLRKPAVLGANRSSSLAELRPDLSVMAAWPRRKRLTPPIKMTAEPCDCQRRSFGATSV